MTINLDYLHNDFISNIPTIICQINAYFYTCTLYYLLDFVQKNYYCNSDFKINENKCIP